MAPEFLPMVKVTVRVRVVPQGFPWRVLELEMAPAAMLPGLHSTHEMIQPRVSAVHISIMSIPSQKPACSG